MSSAQDQLNKVRTRDGFIAALDQSGGSTPKALGLYGIGGDAFANDDEMFSLVHQMRTRIITGKSFNGDRILGSILFENTLDREIQGKSSSRYLWEEKQVAPFLKVDKGLADEADGVQMLKPIPDLGQLLDKAKAQGVFGTKMRSVIKAANGTAIISLVEQQFDLGRQIAATGLIPIIEPEIDINAVDKADAESLLRTQLLAQLDKLKPSELVMLKLTLPETPNYYRACQQHANVVRVVALSGGYTREEANRRLSLNNGMVASFSRALSEGLSAQQTDDEFDRMLDASIQAIFDASVT
jgi:fructose-bisphosphate aldolase class I